MRNSLQSPPMKTGNIFLIGLMGCGKTTIGRHLSRQTGKQFYDSDHEIEAYTGVTIAHIFDIEGEQGFRAREHDMILQLTQRKNIVLATGGGAVLNPDNRHALKNNGTVIYLRAQIEDLLKRTQFDRNRPLLQTENPRQTLENLLTIRDPIYRELADLIIDTSHQHCTQLVQKIINKLQLGKESRS